MDLLSVAANTLWILGLALLLATLSWARWVAHTEHLRWGEVIRRPGVRRALGTGLALFCAGLAATEDRPGVRVLWGALALLWMVQGWWPTREQR